MHLWKNCLSVPDTSPRRGATENSQISEADLMNSLGGEVADPGAAPPPNSKERGAFEISSGEVASKFQAYAALREKAAAAGTTVIVTD